MSDTNIEGDNYHRNREVEELQAQIADLSKQLQQEEGYFSELKRLYKLKSDEVADLSKRLAEMDDEFTHEFDERTKLLKRLAVSDERLEELESENVRNELAVDDLSKRLAEQQEDLVEYKRKAVLKFDALDNLNCEIEKENDGLRKQLTIVQGECTNLLLTKRGLEKRLVEVEAALTHASIEVIDWQSAAGKAEERLAEAEAALQGFANRGYAPAMWYLQKREEALSDG